MTRVRASVVIRVGISAFILLILGIVPLGWSWASHHQTPSQARASHVVLALSAGAAIAGLAALWRPPQH